MFGIDLSQFGINVSTPIVKNINIAKVSSNIVGTNSTISSGAGRIFAYFVSVAIIIAVIILFIHFFIKPISSLQPGASGIFSGNDGKLFWNKTNPSLILNKDLPISNLYYNYSLNIEMFIQNPFQFSRYPRILFSRGAEYKDTPSGNEILGVLSNYNLVIALKPDINDLIVSVLNKNNYMEYVIIPNIPVQEPFRLGIVVMELALEVYLNGRLVKTQPFNAHLKDVKGAIRPAQDIETTIAKLRNLKIWPRILTTSEIRYAKPDLSPATQFAAGPIPNSTTCTANDMNRLEKLSAETTSDPYSLLNSN